MNTYNKRVLIFGGSFNPPTLAHQEIINKGLELPGFDEVWVMPSGDRFDKHFEIEDEHRLDMLKLLKQDQFNDNSRLVISAFELSLTRPTQTTKTVGALAAAHSDIDFWYTFGADSYYDMPKWDDGERLQSTLNMVIVSRNGDIPPTRDGVVTLHITTDPTISSTKVREARAQNLPINGFVCASIANYIDQNALYV